jgi:hypothetical protein
MLFRDVSGRFAVATAALAAATATALASPGEVLSHQKISSTEGGFGGILDGGDQFGTSVVSLDDVDGDGIRDLAVGSLTDDDGGINRGAIWVLLLNNDGTVKGEQKISSLEGGFTGAIDDNDQFGNAVANIGDLDGDGVGDVAVGCAQDDDGGPNRGAVWLLLLNSDGTVKSHEKISSTEGGFTGILADHVRFGVSVASIGDLDGDGNDDLAVGSDWDGDGGYRHGAVWILFLDSQGGVLSHQKISDTEGGFTGPLDDDDRFGYAVCPLGDVDDDGLVDIAASSRRDDDGGPDRGAVWVLFLNGDGTVKAHQKISDTEGGFTGILEDDGGFSHSLSGVGDVDGDGVEDLAVGAIFDDDGGLDQGAVWVLFLNTDGTVKAHQKISETEGGFTGDLEWQDRFGNSLGFLGDHDGDGLGDLAVGAIGDDDGGNAYGAVWVLFLDGALPAPWALDIKPGSCPNSFNRRGNGVLPGALTATEGFDVTQVDLATILLSRADGVGGAVAPHEGPPGPHTVIEDVSAPLDGEGCECDELAPDGVMDLSMKFRSADVVEVLELDSLPAGDLVELVVSGQLLDGTEFSASDCIGLVPPGDINGDGAVGAADFLILLATWGSCPAPPGECAGDLDGDGNVGVSDFLVLLADWGWVAPPPGSAEPSVRHRDAVAF